MSDVDAKEEPAAGSEWKDPAQAAAFGIYSHFVPLISDDKQETIYIQQHSF